MPWYHTVSDFMGLGPSMFQGRLILVEQDLAPIGNVERAQV